ncbi:MAG: tRNA nucleotidyltransferase [Oscillospiraceae bacterium]
MRPDAIIKTLEDAGFEARYVGGCVRDTLLDRPIHDWDIASQALPEDVLRLFPHCVPTGIRHGTVTVLLDGVSAEVTTYRLDGAYHDGRHPDGVRFVRSLAEDLARRDFTINAMAMDESGAVTDLFGGREDLSRRVIRCVGEPETRFREDALRMLRAYRFAAQLGFSLDAQTQAAIRRCAPLCASPLRERVREEAEKTLLSDRPEYFGRMLAEGLLGACIRAENADFSGLSALPKTPEARWTAAKLRCPAFDPAAFRLPAKLCRLIELTAQTWREGRTEAEWKRLIAEHGWETAHLQADLQRTDAVRQIRLRGDCVTLRQLAVTGADFPTLCGKDVGRMLHLLLVYALEHPDQNTKTQLLAAAPSLWQEENKIQG